MRAYFVSDVHLSTARADRVDDFLQFLERCIPGADELYILGDLFDLCLGDDDDLPPNGEIKQALGRAVAAGTPIKLMHGNHDFLMTDDFSRQTGVTLIDDPSIVTMDGRRLLLMHGDSLCTDDTGYQAYKADIRSAQSLARLRAMSITQRLAKAREVMDVSHLAVEHKAPEIMDVNQDAVADAFRAYDTDLIIHGHIHKPGQHNHNVDGVVRQRYVLGDWYVGTSVLVWDAGNIEFHTVNDLLVKGA